MTLDITKSSLQTIGNYDLVEKIAEGGMGTVYKARERSTGQVVAVKVVPPHVTKNPILLKRFEQEYLAASTLDHPNIVRALQYGTEGTTPYLVMEYVEGESLGRKIERDGPIAEAEAIRLIAQVAQGLHKAHKQNLVHRDVKPDNILVTRDGQAKLADLGLVKEVDGDLNLTRTGRGLGTPHFMAPEQFRNAKNADARCDIYSLGATLYMMVTGELPFKSSGPLDAWMKKVNNEIAPPRQLVPTLSERVDWAIRRAMSIEPSQRPVTCREFIEDLTGRSTRKLPQLDATEQDLWFVICVEPQGTTRTLKGSLQGLRRNLKDGQLGDVSQVRASRSKSGPFELLRLLPEFRDLVVPVTPASPAASLKTPPPTPLAPNLQTPSPSSRPTPTPIQQTPTTPFNVASLPTSPESHKVPAPPPKIDLGAAAPRGDWGKWVVLLVIAALAGVLGYLLFPLIFSQ